MPKSIVLLAPTTSAVTSGQFMVDQGTTASLVSNPLANAEMVTVQIYDDAKAAWYNLILDGKSQTLDADTNAIQIYGQGVYRCGKTATVAPVGITVVR